MGEILGLLRRAGGEGGGGGGGTAKARGPEGQRARGPEGGWLGPRQGRKKICTRALQGRSRVGPG